MLFPYFFFFMLPIYLEFLFSRLQNTLGKHYEIWNHGVKNNVSSTVTARRFLRSYLKEYMTSRKLLFCFYLLLVLLKNSCFLSGIFSLASENLAVSSVFILLIVCPLCPKPASLNPVQWLIFVVVADINVNYCIKILFSQIIYWTI